MRFQTIVGCALSATAITLLASCAGTNGSMIAPAAGSNPGSTAVRPNAKPVAFAYISDSVASIISVYGSDGSELGQFRPASPTLPSLRRFEK